MTTDTPYRIEVSAEARRGLHRLPARVASAIVEFISVVLPDNSNRVSKALSGDLEGLRSARRGDYRVLIEIDDVARVVLVVRIAHRADAYRR